MSAFAKSFLLLFVLLNPFIMSVYLLPLVRALPLRVLARQLFRACLISLAVFLVFAWAGDSVFQDVLQVRFSSFLIFGGVTFLLIGIRLILGIGPPVEAIQPDAERVSASIAMPFIVGPGTISASVLAGSRLDASAAAIAIVLSLAASMGAVLLIKVLYDYAKVRNERWVHRYAEIAGRVTALFTGSFAIEMILNGIRRWMETGGGTG